MKLEKLKPLQKTFITGLIILIEILALPKLISPCFDETRMTPFGSVCWWQPNSRVYAETLFVPPVSYLFYLLGGLLFFGGTYLIVKMWFKDSTS
tara:strand:- start:441 stop:722 length:282 start_codon:yes stop_codon:yes gene_type:complete